MLRCLLLGFKEVAMETRFDPVAGPCRGKVNNFNIKPKEEQMKKYVLMMTVLVVGLSLSTGVFAADKDAIKKQVDDIVMAIDSGKMVGEFKEAAYNKPYYVYILEASGNLLVHPTLAGQNLKDKAMPAYEAVTKATPEGTWVKYQWQGKEKNAYVRKTKTGAIVGSGY